MYQFDYDIDDFMSYCQSRNLRPRTMSCYEQALRIFERYMIDVHQVTEASDVREGHIREYIKYLAERGKYTVVINDKTRELNHPEKRPDHNKPMSETSINNYLRNLKVFFNYLAENHDIKSNPFARIKRSLNNDHRPVDYLSDEAFIQLIKSFDLTKFHEFRDCTITQLLIDTGMRVGETLLIKLSDVDMVRRSIYLPPENTKGKKGRMVFYSQEMGKYLKRWLQFKDRYRNSEYLFCTNMGKPLKVSNFETNFKAYTIRVGIKDAHPHMLRNNFAKRFLMNGGSIYTLSRILGHSSVVVTEKAYLDLDNDDLRVNYALYSPLESIVRKNRKP